MITSKITQSIISPIVRAITAPSLGGVTPNIIEHSQEFDNAYWTAQGVTISANTVTAPDGTTTAETLTEAAASGYHNVYVQDILTPGNTYVYSVFAKKGTRRYVAIGHRRIFSNNDVASVFDLDTGAFTHVAGDAISSGSIDAGNGWYRIWVKVDPSNNDFAFGLSSGEFRANTSYVGDVNEFGYFWGAQVQENSLSGYQPTS